MQRACFGRWLAPLRLPPLSDAKVWHCFALDGGAAHAVSIEDNHVVRACMQPRAGQVERLLRTDVPDAPQRPTVDPDKAFGRAVGVEKRIAHAIYLQCSAIEAGPPAALRTERQIARIFHGQGVDLPVKKGLAGQRHLLRNPLALAADRDSEVDPAGIFNQDVEPRIRLLEIDVQIVLLEAPIERSKQFAIRKYL